MRPDDIDANLSGCSFTGPGSYDGNEICFTPDSSGIYEAVLRLTDDCDLVVADTIQITVDYNSAPSVTPLRDTTIYLCNPQPVCLPEGFNPWPCD